MGAWGTGVFENDTALDTMADMASLIDHYYRGLIDSEDEHNIMLAGFIYLMVRSKNNEVIRENIIIEFTKGDADQLLRHEIDFVVSGLALADIEQYKYTLIGRLHKCLDDVSEWNVGSQADRKKEVQRLIDYIAKGV